MRNRKHSANLPSRSGNDRDKVVPGSLRASPARRLGGPQVVQDAQVGRVRGIGTVRPGVAVGTYACAMHMRVLLDDLVRHAVLTAQGGITTMQPRYLREEHRKKQFRPRCVSYDSDLCALGSGSIWSSILGTRPLPHFNCASSLWVQPRLVSILRRYGVSICRGVLRIYRSAQSRSAQGKLFKCSRTCSIVGVHLFLSLNFGGSPVQITASTPHQAAHVSRS